MRILDLFCGAGGAGAGYARAGFEVIGVDIAPQPSYPFEFVRCDAIEFLQLDGLASSFDAIHASPPCQRYTALRTMANHRADHADLIPQTRWLLERAGLPWVIENVPGSPMAHSVMLCGSMFGLGAGGRQLRRHRLFETSFAMLGPTCTHDAGEVLGIYGDHARTARRHGPDSQLLAPDGLEAAREALEMPWANWDGLREAIPPAYTEFIGGFLARLVADDHRAASLGGL